jgi:hypothetical protein
VQSLDCGQTPETPAYGTPHPDSVKSENIMILQSPLDPEIPIDSVREVADDGKYYTQGVV